MDGWPGGGTGPGSHADWGAGGGEQPRSDALPPLPAQGTGYLPCGNCVGSGVLAASGESCSFCAGTGKVMCTACLCTGKQLATEHDPRIDPFNLLGGE